MALCRVGTRLVSLPFADHCDILASDRERSRESMEYVRTEVDRSCLRHVEVRPLSDDGLATCGFQVSQSYWFHELDLTPNTEQLFRRLHKNSFQRKIRRAEKERLSYEAGKSSQFIDEFYRLLLLTRRRHRLIPQPRVWFENLLRYTGPGLKIRLARKDGVAIAAMLTIEHGSALVYKYGWSDARFHNLGGVPFLFWKMIEEAKSYGIARIDLGRSDTDNKGLVTFKDRLGTTKKLCRYYRYTNSTSLDLMKGWSASRSLSFLRRHAGGFFTGVPDVVLSTAGRVLYKHLG
jgi:hypothetical protein